MGLTIPILNISLSPLHCLLLAVLVLFVIAVIQASVAVIRYRRNFGDAPLPIIPAHGVVIAKDKGDSHWKLPEESLRLLLVGDSLACGVGQSVRCTPVMPEVISRELSRATGKAVFWTCHGESGASAGWIIRELEGGINDDNGVDMEYGACGSEDVEVEGTMAQGEILVWKDRLDKYRRRFDPSDELGPYDIVVVLTGTNDLKIMLFPCLIVEQDRELRRRQSSGGFIEDLQALIEALSDRMKQGMQNISERAGRVSRRIRGSTEDFESLLDTVAASSPVTVPESMEHTLSSEFSVDEQSERNRTRSWSPRTPLFVLPAMPIRTSPSIRPVPLRWPTVFVFDRMEAKKKKLAKANPDEMLWVKDPSLKDIIDYEEQHGSIWEQCKQVEVLLSLRCVRGGAAITAAMREYYQTKGESFDPVNDPKPLCQRPGKPGTKVYCADRIHPNEEGYAFWGHNIANAIIVHMKRNKASLHGSRRRAKMV